LSSVSDWLMCKLKTLQLYEWIESGMYIH